MAVRVPAKKVSLKVPLVSKIICEECGEQFSFEELIEIAYSSAVDYLFDGDDADKRATERALKAAQRDMKSTLKNPPLPRIRCPHCNHFQEWMRLSIKNEHKQLLFIALWFLVYILYIVFKFIPIKIIINHAFVLFFFHA